MKVLFLTSGDVTPSTRYRVLPFARKLQESGVHCTVKSGFPTKYEYIPRLGFRPSQKLKRCTRLWNLAQAAVSRVDIVYLERELFDDTSSWLDLWFRRVGRRFVLDVDDAVFLRYPGKIERLARAADLVIAGNSWLERVLAQWNDQIVVIPTGVELAAFAPKDHAQRHSDVPIVGWMGTSGNLQYLKEVAPALRRLAEQRPFELRLIVPDLEPLAGVDLTGVTIRHIPWRAETEVAELHRIDVGIMPLFADQKWDRYKCPTKLIQYMAIGVPVVASPIGFTGDVLTEGVDGFYADTPDAWVRALSELLADPDLRQQVGRSARETVADKYCVEANLPVMAAAFDRVLEQPPRSSTRSESD